MRIGCQTLLVVAVSAILAGCGPDAPAGPKVDCEIEPLPNPTMRIGEDDMPPGSHLNVRGAVLEYSSQRGKSALLMADAVHGEVSVFWTLPRGLPLDLRKGQNIQLDYWRRDGFEGSARGLRIKDDAGVVLLVDDGEYGNAIEAAELAPFSVTQKDAGCRNRRNLPGSLNNAFLVVTLGAEKVSLIHGDSAQIQHDGHTYEVLCTRSTAKVGDVVWTDAPYEFRSFAILRRP